MSFMQRNAQIWRSYRSLPLWVQLWVGLILVPVNVAPLFFLDTPIGRMAVLAFLFVGATNLPIMYWARGMTRLMSVPHLFAWIPLVGFVVVRLYGTNGAPVSSAEWMLGWALLAVDGFSLVFDLLDSWRWVRGEREMPGIPGPG